jgi:hypothetical protein
MCAQAADEAAARVALAEGRGADLSATLSAQRKATDDADARARATDGARHAAAVALGVSDGRAVALGYEAEMLRERGERLEEDLETVRGWAGAAGPHGTCPDLPSSLLIPSSRTLQTTQRAEAERLRLSARSEELLACLHSMRQTMAHAQGQMALHVGTSGHNAQRADEERRAVQVGIKISYITFVDKE